MEGFNLTAFRSIVCLLSLFVAFAPHSTATAAGESPVTRDGPYVRPKLIAEHMNFAPGRRVWLALEFAIEPSWHMYWHGQNDTGMAPLLEFDLPPDFKVNEVLWPSPRRHVAAGDLVDSIVEKQMTLLIGIDVPVNAKTSTDARIAVKAEWLVCQEACVLENTALELTLPIRSSTPALEVDPKSTGIFAAARERIPRKWPRKEEPATIKWKDSVVTIESPGAKELVFHAEEAGIALESTLKDGAAKGATIQFRLKSASTPEQRLLGVLEIRKDGKEPAYFAVSLPQPAVKPPG